MMFDGPETRKELAEYYHEVSRTDHYAGLLEDELQTQGILDQTLFHLLLRQWSAFSPVQNLSVRQRNQDANC